MKMVFNEDDVLRILTAYVSNNLQVSDGLLRASSAGYSYDRRIEVEILDRAPEPDPVLHDVVTDFGHLTQVAA